MQKSLKLGDFLFKDFFYDQIERLAGIKCPLSL